jgi:hypothetical protein
MDYRLPCIVGHNVFQIALPSKKALTYQVQQLRAFDYHIVYI